MISSATTKPKIAVPSARAAPSSRLVWIKLVVPVFVPAVFSLYFDLFDGLIQTYVFVFLTSLFMKESIGGEE